MKIPHEVNDDLKKCFSERLQKLRKEKYNSQEKFSEAMDVSVETVKKWEQGKAFPETGHLLLIPDVLDCDLDYLIGRIDHQSRNRKISQDYTGLSEKAAKTLHEWKNSHDQRKYWSTVVSMMIGDPRFSDIMENICSAQYVFRKLSNSDSEENVKITDEKATILAFLWYISKGFSDIAEDLISIKYDVY